MTIWHELQTEFTLNNPGEKRIRGTGKVVAPTFKDGCQEKWDTKRREVLPANFSGGTGRERKLSPAELTTCVEYFNFPLYYGYDSDNVLKEKLQQANKNATQTKFR